VRDTLDHGFVARFIRGADAPADAPYDDIRVMVAAAEAADFMNLR
jgi:hypothetical protein